jgi:cyclic-di-GMP-binding biofilm dispersal mediator protein
MDPRPSEPSNRDLDGTSALVVGASGGLGRAIAEELARRGATLTMVGRNRERLEAVDAPGLQLIADLRTPDACTDVVAQALRHGGRLDVVVNAVGVVAFGSLDELGLDAMEELFLTNTFIPIMLTKAAAAAMGPGGVIVHISGVIAEQNLPGMAAYGASKAAVRSFDEAVQRELRRRRIRLIDARPPHTETELSRHPIEGTAPTMPAGLRPTAVARVIVDSVASSTTTDLPSSAFTTTTPEATS